MAAYRSIGDEPDDIGSMYQLSYTGIDAIDHGDDYALGVLADLEGKVPEWLRVHREMEHSYPSPSGIMRCRLQQWFDARKMKPDQTSPRGWKVRRAMGIISEPYWLAVLGSGGADLAMSNEKFDCGPHMWAHPDAIMNGEFLVEIKSVSGWGYRKMLESWGGVEMVEKGHYVQAQLYMYATGMPWTLYLTWPADFGQTQSSMRQKKRYGKYYEMQPLYLEWIPRNKDAIEMALERAEMIAKDKRSKTPPQREFAGVEFDPKGKRTWPCGYCLHLGKCNDIIRKEVETDEPDVTFV